MTIKSLHRSYNTPNLMTKFQGEGVTLMDLIQASVVELKWRWTVLERFAKARGIDLDIVDRELSSLGIEEGDVGVVEGESLHTAYRNPAHCCESLDLPSPPVTAHELHHVADPEVSMHVLAQRRYASEQGMFHDLQLTL